MALERSVGELSGESGLKPLLLAQNLSFNSGAAPNYKYMLYMVSIMKTNILKILQPNMENF